MASPANGDDFQSYPDLFRVMMLAARQRSMAAGGCETPWPKSANIRENGEIGALTDLGSNSWRIEDNTLYHPDGTHITTGSPAVNITTSNKDWTIPAGASGKLWVGYVSPPANDTCYLDGNFDVILAVGGAFPYGGHWDETKQIRCPITDNTSSPTVTLTFDATNAINAGVAGYWSGDVADLTTCRYYIIPRGDASGGSAAGTWWADHDDALSRWMAYPNSREYWHGAVAAYDSTTFVLTQLLDVYTGKTVSWTTDQFAGQELLCMVGSLLKRLTIASNTNNTITLTSGAFALSGDFIIVNVGGVGFPDFRTRKFYPFRWYGAAQKSVYTVDADDDQEAQVHIPASSVTYSTRNELGDCAEALKFTFDDNTDDDAEHESWTSYEEQCDCPSGSGRVYSPDFYKTIRGLQKWLEYYCGFFLNPDLGSAPLHPPFNFATLLRSLGVNSGSSTTTESGGNFSFAVPSALNGSRIYYCVVDSGGYVINRGGGDKQGWATVSAASVSLGSDMWDATEVAADPTNKTLDTGLTVYYTRGFTREFPKAVRFAWPKTIWIPDTDIVDDVSVALSDAVQDFATTGCYGVGTFETRDRSTAFAEYNTFGVLDDGSTAFTVGDVARIVGENAQDPSTRGGSSVNASEVEEDDGTVRFRARFFEGNHTASHQNAITESLSGTVTLKMSANSLTDDSKNWYDNWHDGGLERAETGTATGGSTTTVVDTTKDTSLVGGCFFTTARFPATSVGFKDFIIKFTSGANNGLKRVITNFNAATKTITFAPALPTAVAASDTYSIAEADEVNRFQGRVLRLYDDEGGWDDVPITHSDNDTLFWSTSSIFSATVRQRYRIIQPRYGGIYKYTATQPTEADGDIDYYQADATHYWVPLVKGVSDPRGQPWHKSVFENLPHKADTAYGFFRIGDYVTTTLLANVWDAIAKLCLTDEGIGSWVNDDAPNTRFGSNPGGGGIASAGDFAAAKSVATDGTTPGCCFCPGYYNKCCVTPAVCGTTTHGLPYAWSDASGGWHYWRADAPCNVVIDPPHYNDNTWQWSVEEPGSNSIQRHYDQYQVHPSDCLWKTVGFYNFATEPDPDLAESDSPTVVRGTWEFSANGDRVAENAWTRWSEVRQLSGAITSAALGSHGTTAPEWCAMPPIQSGGAPPNAPADYAHLCTNSYSVSVSASKGYVVTDVRAIVLWEFDWIPCGSSFASMTEAAFADLSEGDFADLAE